MTTMLNAKQRKLGAYKAVEWGGGGGGDVSLRETGSLTLERAEGCQFRPPAITQN